MSSPETQPLDGERWRLTPSTAPQCKRVTCKGGEQLNTLQLQKQAGNQTLLQKYRDLL